MLDPAYMFGQPLEQTAAEGQDKSKKGFKNTDHFGGELKYFSTAFSTDGTRTGWRGGPCRRSRVGGRARGTEIRRFGEASAVRPQQAHQHGGAEDGTSGCLDTGFGRLVDASNPAKGVEKQAKN
jgi:hypothetical protein